MSSALSLLPLLLVIMSIRITVSGERRPCAVGNAGRVSLELRTEFDKGIVESLLDFGFVGFRFL
jgi:hypothetical protein